MVRKRVWIPLVSFVLLGIVAVGAYQWGQSSRNAVAPEPPAEKSTAVVVQIEVKGRLQPAERAVVYPSEEGVVRECRVRPGELVAPQATLFVLFSKNLEEKYVHLIHERNEAQAKYNAAAKLLADPSIKTDERQRLQEKSNEEELRLRNATQQLTLLADRSRMLPNRPGWFEVHAPDFVKTTAQAAGTPRWTVLSGDPTALLGRTVRPSEPLLSLGNLEGHWQIELTIPEREIGHVLRAFADPGAGIQEKNGQKWKYLDVELFLPDRPDAPYLGRLFQNRVPPAITREDGRETGAETTVNLDDDAIPADRRLPRTQYLVGREVRCLIRCTATGDTGA